MIERLADGRLATFATSGLFWVSVMLFDPEDASTLRILRACPADRTIGFFTAATLMPE